MEGEVVPPPLKGCKKVKWSAQEEQEQWTEWPRFWAGISGQIWCCTVQQPRCTVHCQCWTVHPPPPSVYCPNLFRSNNDIREHPQQVGSQSEKRKGEQKKNESGDQPRHPWGPARRGGVFASQPSVLARGPGSQGHQPQLLRTPYHKPTQTNQNV